MLQQKLISLQKVLERCKTKSETDKTWDSILRTKKELKDLLGQPEKATSSAAAPEPWEEQPEKASAAAPEPWDEAPRGGWYCRGLNNLYRVPLKGSIRVIIRV